MHYKRFLLACIIYEVEGFVFIKIASKLIYKTLNSEVFNSMDIILKQINRTIQGSPI